MEGGSRWRTWGLAGGVVWGSGVGPVGVRCGSGVGQVWVKGYEDNTAVLHRKKAGML